jgi:predicted DNA-binding transcriptional regulator YafY
VPGRVQEALRTVLARRLVSLRELAREIGVSDRSLRRWLAGSRCLASDKLLALKVAAVRRFEAIAMEAAYWQTGAGWYALRDATGRGKEER